MTPDERRLAIDVIVPLYNEEQVVAEFHRRLMNVVSPLRSTTSTTAPWTTPGTSLRS
jgi:hypothetical protein